MKSNKKTPTNTRDWAVFILGLLTPLVIFSDKISNITAAMGHGGGEGAMVAGNGGGGGGDGGG